MMMFNKFDAIALFGPCGLEEHIKFDDRGVWPAAERGAQPAVKSDDKEHQAACTLASEFSLWRPAQEFANDPHILGKERKSVAQSPMLPFPFNARALAAFMLYGIGVQVSDHYGSWTTGPDLERLDDIPQSEGMARLAVKDAYDAYREAIKKVGPYPLALIKDANNARNAYDEANDQANAREGVFSARPGTDDSKVRRERAVASTAALESEMESTAAAAEVASEAWRNAMVRLLLQPAPEKDTAAHAPVGVEGAYIAQPKQRSQEIRILELLKMNGYDPLALAQRKPGKPGPKAEIRTLAMNEPALFSIKSFDKAWERLRGDGSVVGVD